MDGDGRDAPDTFARLLDEALPGVEPLADRPPDRPRPARRKRRPASLATRAPAFTVERLGAVVEGLARGGDLRLLDGLRAGAPGADARVDLHGHGRDAARAALAEAVRRAAAAGHRRLLVVHGRGLRSAAGPVLKEAVPGWLTAAPLARHVLAFATPPAALGGAGALLVLLR